MKEVQIFNNPIFGDFRAILDESNEPLFCLADICRALNIQNVGNVRARLDSDDIRQADIADSLGKSQGMTFVTEPGLYTVILRSDSPLAKPMQKWVTNEVLPSIRKHGGYLTAEKIEEALCNPDTIIRLATDLKKEREERARLQIENERQILALKEAEPKIIFADAVSTSPKSILISELAKILKQNGIEIGQNRLFQWLREHGYLCHKGEYYNQPTQRAMELGLFELKKTTINQPGGTIFVTVTPKVTGKGQIYFVRKFIPAA